MRAQAWASDLVSKVALGWIALTADLRFPLSFINGWTAIPDCCHFDHSRHN